MTPGLNQTRSPILLMNGKPACPAITMSVPAAANSAAISVSWDANTNRLMHVTPPWMTRNLQPGTLKVMNPGSAAIHRRLAAETGATRIVCDANNTS